jgi:hypothetical protein
MEKIEVLSRTGRATGNKYAVTIRSSKRVNQGHTYSKLTLNRTIQDWPRKSSPPSVLHCKSLCYIGYTSTWLDVRSCVLMQEATTFSIFYDGLSFQRLAIVLISVFTLCYGPGLLFRGPYCTIIPMKLYMRFQASTAV